MISIQVRNKLQVTNSCNWHTNLSFVVFMNGNKSADPLSSRSFQQMSFYLSFISHLGWRVESVSWYSKSKDQNIFNPFAYLYVILWKLVLLMKLKHSNILFNLKASVKKSIQTKYFHAVCPKLKITTQNQCWVW